MKVAYICDAVRTPFGRYGGALSTIRSDDLAALPIAWLVERNSHVDWQRLDEVIFGCANQAGEDNRNVARMASLLAGLPDSVPGMTVNRLCGSGLEAVCQAARAIACGEADLVMAGGVESMSRAPLVVGKAASAYSRTQTLEDTTLGWRFVNPRMRDRYGVDSMAATAENVAAQFNVTRAEQDAYALRSQRRCAQARASGFFDAEIQAVEHIDANGTRTVLNADEHPRPKSSIDGLAALRPVVHQDGTVTAGNASGINDGACALLLASEAAVKAHELEPRARVLGFASAGVAPRIMGMGPVPATQKLLARLGVGIDQLDTIELNEAFAAQVLAVLRMLELPDDDAHVNPNGGAIAIGHPLGASGARLVMTAINQLERITGKHGLCTMCVGVGQGVALAIERV